MREPLILPGCTPEPLMAYLKALGVFRLVAEQADDAARLSWNDTQARLHTVFDRDGLMHFFLHRYRPTPILAPWGGGSGFYGGGSEPLDKIALSTAQQLALYRSTIAMIRGFIPTGKPKDEQKQALLRRCRAELSDEVVPWLDTCFVLEQDGPSYFPLLGTGGNDGRLDFTNNFFQRLANVISFDNGKVPPSESSGWLKSSLFADDPSLTSLDKAAIGQFNPGGIGGANGVQGEFEAGSQVNPWDFVLMIEGAMLFAGSVARRFSANASSRAVFPFTVESVAVGYGSATASEETSDGSRAELWLPLWDEPASLSEVRHLFAEGRAQVGRRQARHAVEFALAACTLGVSRGVKSFFRYGFLKRNGLSFLATPLGRIPVTPKPQARLLEDPPLRVWIERLRTACREKDKTPTRYQTALRNIDRAIFDFAVRSERDEPGERRALLEVLRALGRAERTLAKGLRFCKDKGIRPLQQLDPRWLLDAAPADDSGREFRLAASLASILGEGKQSPVGPFRTQLEEVEQTRQGIRWSPGSTSAVWSNRPLVDNLAAVFLRRWMESERSGMLGLAQRTWLFASLSDVAAFLNDEVDGEKLTDLLWGLVGLNWAAPWCGQPENRQEVRKQFRSPVSSNPPPEFGILRLLTQPIWLRAVSAESRGGRQEQDKQWQVVKSGDTLGLMIKPEGKAFHLLYRANLEKLREAMEVASRRLWFCQLIPFGWANRHRRQEKYATECKIDPLRLLATCLFPLSRGALTRLARQVLSSPLMEP